MLILVWIPAAACQPGMHFTWEGFGCSWGGVVRYAFHLGVQLRVLFGFAGIYL
jgi:hypothetical protein